MAEVTIHDLLERIAADAVAAEASATDALVSLRTGLEELEQMLAETGPDAAQAAIAGATSLLTHVIERTAYDPNGSLDATRDLLKQVQVMLTSGGIVALPSDADFDAFEAAEGVASAVGRDEETIGLFAEFISEAGESIDAADQILLKVEQGTAEDDAVDKLFRIIHTVKGVSGFLSLKDMCQTCHATEGLLNRVRNAELDFRGPVVEAIFDSTRLIRKMLDVTMAAVSADTEIPRLPEFAQFLTQVENLTLAGIAAPHSRATELARAPKRAPAVPEAATQPEAPVPAPASSPRVAAEAPARAAPTPVDSDPDASERSDAKKGDGFDTGGKRIRETVKVDLERVEHLIEMIGELVVTESMVTHAPEISAIASPSTRKYFGQLTKITRDLQNVGMRMRMVPLAGIFQKMSRMARDLSRKSGKAVRLVTVGESTEVDRSMVEQLNDPLVHMIRNAVDHGIESASDRAASGKPDVGTVTLSAYHEGGSVVIEIGDDGKGLDRNAIVNKARARGLIGPAESLAESEIFGLIFQPGFSTAAKVTEISGRGVGMDVVKRKIEAIRGNVEITSQPGRGTSFRIVLPLTLAIIDGVLVICGTERYVIPTLSILESIRPSREMLFTLGEEHELLYVRGETIPMVRLHELFDVDGARRDPLEGLVVILENAGRKVGLLVDDVLAQQQVVIKSLGPAMHDVRCVSGGAILSDGRIGLILNVDAIARLAKERGPRKHDIAIDAIVSSRGAAAEQPSAWRSTR